MRKFFEPFLFEELPATDRLASEAYLSEVADCDLYIGLFGKDYGYDNQDGLSPTEQKCNKVAARKN